MTNRPTGYVIRIPVKNSVGDNPDFPISQKAVTDALQVKVPQERSINGNPLTEDVNLTSESVGTYSKEEIDVMISELFKSPVLVGQGTYFQNNLANKVYYKGCTYLKSGVTIDPYELPDYPEELKIGVSYPLTHSPSSEVALSINFIFIVGCDDYVLGFTQDGLNYFRFTLNEAKTHVVWTAHEAPFNIGELISNGESMGSSSTPPKWNKHHRVPPYAMIGHGNKVVGFNHYTENGIDWAETADHGLPLTLSGYDLTEGSITVSPDTGIFYKCYLYTQITQKLDHNEQTIKFRLGKKTSQEHMVFKSLDGIVWERIPSETLPVLSNPDESLDWCNIDRVVTDGEYVSYFSDSVWKHYFNSNQNNVNVTGNPTTLNLDTQLPTDVVGWDVMLNDVWLRWSGYYNEVSQSRDKGKTTSVYMPSTFNPAVILSPLGIYTKGRDSKNWQISKATPTGFDYSGFTLTPGTAPGTPATRDQLVIGGNREFTIIGDNVKSFGYRIHSQTNTVSLEGDFSPIGITVAVPGLYLRIE